VAATHQLLSEHDYFVTEVDENRRATARYRKAFAPIAQRLILALCVKASTSTKRSMCSGSILVVRGSSLCTTKMDGVMNEPSAGSATERAGGCCEIECCLQEACDSGGELGARTLQHDFQTRLSCYACNNLSREQRPFERVAGFTRGSEDRRSPFRGWPRGLAFRLLTCPAP
jgi:hypothetical protein